nr:AraC family transcriptional regulator [Phytohabitans suffuscus]
MEEIIERVIRHLKLHLGDPISIDDMARSARLSKFHFSRVFRRVTGMSPGRYLSTLRLNEAKRLLVETSLNVTDISHRVGYTSVGTFTTRFTNSVGISPTAFRRFGGFAPGVAVLSRRETAGQQPAMVRGESAVRQAV